MCFAKIFFHVDLILHQPVQLTLCRRDAYTHANYASMSISTWFISNIFYFQTPQLWNVGDHLPGKDWSSCCYLTRDRVFYCFSPDTFKLKQFFGKALYWDVSWQPDKLESHDSLPNSFLSQDNFCWSHHSL